MCYHGRTKERKIINIFEEDSCDHESSDSENIESDFDGSTDSYVQDSNDDGSDASDSTVIGNYEINVDNHENKTLGKRLEVLCTFMKKKINQSILQQKYIAYRSITVPFML